MRFVTSIAAVVLLMLASRVSVSRAASDDPATCNNATRLGGVAIDACTRAIDAGDMNSRNPAIAYNNRGIAYAASGGAVEDNSQAIQQDWDYCGGTDPARSIPACSRIIAQQHENAKDRSDAYLFRAGAYLSGGDIDHAVADYDKAIQLTPQNAVAYASRAIAYLHKGDRDRALADYRQASAIDPATISGITANNAELTGLASPALTGPAIAAIGIGIAVIIIGLVWLIKRASRPQSKQGHVTPGSQPDRPRPSHENAYHAKNAEPVRRHIASAILEDLKDGTQYLIRSKAEIGRDAANDMVLHDQTVSRQQALIEDMGDGIFWLENRSSTNQTLVNGHVVERIQLYDDDLLTMGERKFRFSRVN